MVNSLEFNTVKNIRRCKFWIHLYSNVNLLKVNSFQICYLFAVKMILHSIKQVKKQFKAFTTLHRNCYDVIKHAIIINISNLFL